MDGKGRCVYNVFVDFLLRTVKYDEIYPESYDSQVDTQAQLATFFRFYNDHRPYSAFADANPLTPMEAYHWYFPIALSA